MAGSKFVLSPAEFSGEPNTCVCGRVVLMRGPITLNDAQPSKGKGKGSGKKKEAVHKLEVHLLGGQTANRCL